MVEQIQNQIQEKIEFLQFQQGKRKELGNKKYPLIALRGSMKTVK